MTKGKNDIVKLFEKNRITILVAKKGYIFEYK